MKFLPDTGKGGGNRYVDPNAPVVITQLGGSGRMAAETINDLANEPRDLTATVAARGSLVPVLYGRRDVPGMVFAAGKIGTDFVIGYIWCIGEVDSVETLYLNDAPVPAGVTVTHYKGTPTQGVDGTLAAAVAAYSDTLRYDIPGGGKLGVCYSVVRIPVGALGGFPRARAVIRGRKVLDPRTGTIVYTANPALHLNDLITNPVFGLGRAVVGVNACADWCDTLLGGLPGVFRARAALYLASGRPAEQYIDLLCEYAECVKVNEGSTIKLIPDAPVDLTTAPIIGPADIIAGSFSLSADSSIDTPSEVELQYTQEPAVGSQAWALAPVVQRLPGVSEGVVQRVPTSITLDGVYRAAEAGNKAQARLNRMQNRMNASWQTLDIGVQHQRGDVKRIELPMRGISMAFRIESITMAGYGRYNVTATRYDLNHYPSDVVLPEGDGIVPEGAIALLTGPDVPPGWALFSAPNGRYIVGAGGGLSPGATGGDNTLAGWSANLDPGGAHAGISDVASFVAGGSGYEHPVNPPGDAPNHTHTVSGGALGMDLLRHGRPLIIKTGGADVSLPSAVQVLGLANTATLATKITAHGGRLFVANGTQADAGVSSQSANLSTSAAGGHYHNYHSPGTDRTVFGGTPPGHIVNEVAPHTHTVFTTFTARVKRQQVCLFGSAANYTIRAGMIFMWSGSLGSLPADYVLCNGVNGTPDMRDRFLELAGATPNGPQGDNTVAITGTVSTEGHSHDIGTFPGYPGKGTASHAATIYHSHTTSIPPKAFTPAYYALAFIMYAPAG